MSMETQDTIDIRERGRAADGSIVATDRRLFMQFLAFGGCTETAPFAQALEAARFSGAV